MKKLAVYVLGLLWVVTMWVATVQANGLQGWGRFVDNPSTNSPGGTSSDTVNVGDTATGQQERLLDVVKRFINYVLGLLAFIALVILLYGWFTMITAAGSDDGYKKWFTILKNAALWLAFIAVAWLVVSLIFFVLGLVTT